MNDSISSEIAALFSAGEYKAITDKYLSYADKADCELLRVIAQSAYLASETDKAKDLLLTASVKFKDQAAVWHDLAFYQSKLNDYSAAERAILNSIKLRPEYAASRLLAGNILKALNKFDAAILEYKKAAELEINNNIALNNLATTLVRIGRYAEAESVYLKALPFGQLNTEYNYANLLEMRGESAKAISIYKDIVAKNPGFYAAWNNLGQALQNSNQLAEAEKCFDSALLLKPDLHEAKLNKAKLFILRGQVEKSRLLLKEITDSVFATLAQLNLCYVSNFSDKLSASELAEEHKKLFKLLNAPLNKLEKHKNKKIKIGYLSADFRLHSVAYFIEGLLRTHDKSKFEIHLYANQTLSDRMTDQIKLHADYWNEVRYMSDPELTAKIKADQIDILIDLSGLTNGNRIMVLAERAAPVQINYLGYPHSTGIPNVDYRIVDSITDPEGSLATEKLIYLNPCFVCYQPENLPVIKKTGKNFTFGSFNALAKLSDSLLECWADILKQLPESQLLLKAYGILESKENLKERFAKLGVPESRLVLVEYAADKAEHLSLYNKVDLALDSFPYCGTTTTCEALSMNVPVLTLSGDRHSARVGHSLLSAVGLNELVSINKQEYIEKAVSIATEPERLQELKKKLSDNFKNSDLCNQQKFTESWERLLIQLYK